ncbi:MAG: extracellular solute-binding protein [Clostridiaceae bacterium]|nr:extracellular solute-binding protein [Clostridiaceae bacterium]
MKKRLFICILALFLIVLGISGCGDAKVQTKDTNVQQGSSDTKSIDGGTQQSTASSKYQTTYGSKKFNNVKITVELFDRSNAPEGSTITDNKWVKYVNEQMNKVGITVEFIPVPRWDEVTKMQAMMASGTAPDITLTYTYAHAESYFNQGGTWDLTEFIDGPDQALNMKKYLGKDVLDIGRNANKQLYGIVARRATTAKSNLFIRKDWMDKLGLSIPQTPDELYDVIYKMVYNNPDGRKDAIGAITWNAWNMKMAFSQVASNKTKAAIANGDDAFADYYDPGMREYYRFMNKLYNAGLMNKEYYTMSEDNFKTYIATGTVAFFEYAVNGSVDVLRGSLLKTLQENVPGADIISIQPLKNVNDGKQYSAGYALGGLINFCPKTASAEKVEACMTYLDWLCTKDGGFAIYHGFEGEHFNYDQNGVPVVINAEYNSKDKDWIRTDLFLTGNQGYFATVDDFNACTAKEAPGYEQHVIDNYRNALTGIIVNDTTYTSPSTPDLITDIGLVRDEYTVQCITCPEAEFDATYDKYMAELEKVGIKTIIEERTKYFTELYGN